VEERLTELGVLQGDRWTFEIEMEQDYATHSKRLWAPVRQLYIYQVGDQVIAEESDCKQFGSIVLSSNFFRHHMPMEYDRLLISMIKRLRKEELEREQEPVAPANLSMNDSEEPSFIKDDLPLEDVSAMIDQRQED
jgi:hypothetical protein